MICFFYWKWQIKSYVIIAYLVRKSALSLLEIELLLPVCPKIHSNYDITAWHKLDWGKIQLLFSSRVMDPFQVPLLQLHFQIMSPPVMQNSPCPWKSVPGSSKLLPHCPNQYCNARIQKTSSAYSRTNIQRIEILSHVF